MDIKEFKRLLFEGAVKFTFKKNDGTVRNAKGTMNESLLPNAEPAAKKFKVYDIEWGDDTVKRRRACKIGVLQEDVDKFGDDEQGLVEAALAKKFGAKPASFKHELITEEEGRKMPPGHILFYDLERGGFRSLREETLISFEKA